MVKHAVCCDSGFPIYQKGERDKEFQTLWFTLDSSIKIHMVHFFFLILKSQLPSLQRNSLFVLLVGFLNLPSNKATSPCIFLLLCSTDGVHMQISDFLINTVALGNICKVL